MRSSRVNKKDKESLTRAPIARKQFPSSALKIAHIKLCWPPSEEADQNKLADELLQWAYHSNGNKIEDFAISKHMNPYRFRTLCLKNEYFKECYELACYIMSSRLQDGVHDKTLDKELSLQMLPLYHKEYREWKKEIKQMSSNNDPAKTTFNVYMPKIESSPLVPERVDERRDSDSFEQVQTEMVSAAPDGRDRE